MKKRLTLLTPLTYHFARLRRALCRQRTGIVIFGMALGVASAVRYGPIFPPDPAAGAPLAPSLDLRAVRCTPQPTAVMTAVSPLPTHTPQPTPTQVTAATLPQVTSGIVWGRFATGIYLWTAPDGKILARLRNGTAVRFLPERSSYGNLPWVSVQSPKGPGWILLTEVFRDSRKPVAYIAAEQGTFLRDQPRGGVAQGLSLGTPIMEVLSTQEVDARTWAQVEVVNGAVGWVVEDWLANELPASFLDD